MEDRCSGYQIAQATGSDIDWIAKLEKKLYSADAIPEQVLREWYAANPNGFSIIKGHSGKPIGHLDILPLRPSTLDAFCKGNIVESEIRGDSLYSEKERHLITALYVESLILRPERPLTPASAMMCVLKNLQTLIERVTDPSSLDKVYAIAATGAGEKLMRRLSFVLEGSRERRKDHHHLFVARFSELSKRAERFSGNQPSLARSIEAGL